MSQHAIPLVYGNFRLERCYRLDFLVEDLVVVEVKALDRLLPVHRAQMLTYLRLTGCPVGLVLNFCAPVLKEGIMRVANGYPDGDEDPEELERAEEIGDEEKIGDEDRVGDEEAQRR